MVYDEEYEDLCIEIQDLRTKVAQLYKERNCLAIAAAKLAIKAGLSAGKGVDIHCANSNVVYIEVSPGMQVSWHISDSESELLGVLPTHTKVWDGTFFGRERGWVEYI